MRGVLWLGMAGLAACSAKPLCLYQDCTENIAETCSQLLAAGSACSTPLASSATGDCRTELGMNCSESDSVGLANATGCFGPSTACGGGQKTVEGCFAAQTLSSDCRSTVDAQVRVFLPDAG